MGPESTSVFALIAGLLLALAVVALARAARLKRMHGLAEGKVVYSDTGASRIAARPLYSPRYGLTGKPDYLLTTRRGLVPVEVKPTRDDAEPRESHLLQVLAYCLLVEESQGRRPPYGLLRYRTETFKVEYNNDTRAQVIDVIEKMHEAMHGGEVHRSHDQPGRCRACAYVELCDEALV